MKLPRLEEGDFVVIRDCGANTLSTFSRHCSRLTPPVWSFEGEGEVELKLEVEGGKVDEVLNFWRGGGRPVGSNLKRKSDTVLIVVDVQPEYWSDLDEGSDIRGDFPEFPENMARTLAKCRRRGTELVWVRASYGGEGSPSLNQFAELNKDKPTTISCDAENRWETFASPWRGELLVAKPSWGVKDTALLDWLRVGEFNNVLVCGLLTSVCVQQTSFSIFEASFKVSVVVDACADRGRWRHDTAISLYGGYMYNVVRGLGEGLEGGGGRPFSLRC